MSRRKVLVRVPKSQHKQNVYEEKEQELPLKLSLTTTKGSSHVGKQYTIMSPTRSEKMKNNGKLINQIPTGPRYDETSKLVPYSILGEPEEFEEMERVKEGNKINDRKHGGSESGRLSRNSSRRLSTRDRALLRKRKKSMRAMSGQQKGGRHSSPGITVEETEEEPDNLDTYRERLEKNDDLEATIRKCFEASQNERFDFEEELKGLDQFPCEKVAEQREERGIY